MTPREANLIDRFYDVFDPRKPFHQKALWTELTISELAQLILDFLPVYEEQGVRKEYARRLETYLRDRGKYLALPLIERLFAKEPDRPIYPNRETVIRHVLDEAYEIVGKLQKGLQGSGLPKTHQLFDQVQAFHLRMEQVKPRVLRVVYPGSGPMPTIDHF